MENASKALIIAGAILIAILLISSGVLIINSTGGVREEIQSSSDNLEVQSFNEQFTAYEGGLVSASQVKSLLLLVNANNSYYEFDNNTAVGTDKFIKVSGVVSSGLLYANKTYTVKVTSYSPNGYVSIITISQNM